MSSRLKYSAASAAVCLGDEIQELSDEEQRQMRIEMENQKDQHAERWQVEADQASGGRSKTAQSRRRRVKGDGTSLEGDASNRSLASSRGSDYAVHHYQDRTQGSESSAKGFQRLELDLDKTRLRTPSATSQGSQRTSGLYRVGSSTTYTDLESANSGRSAISARKERLLRLAAERGVGITPISDMDELEHIPEGIESHYNIQGNISQKGESIAGLCLADEIADELEAEEMEEEFASDFPVPPGMNDQAGLTGLGILGTDMFVQPFGTGQPQSKSKTSSGLARFVGMRRGSANSQASGSTASFSAVGPPADGWVASTPSSVAPSNRTFQTNQSDTSSQIRNGSERGSDKGIGKRGAFKAFLKSVSGTNAPSSKGIENIASKSAIPAHRFQSRPTPILKTSTSLAASRSEGNLPAALRSQKQVPAPTPSWPDARDPVVKGQGDPGLPRSTEAIDPLDAELERGKNNITPTMARRPKQAINDATIMQKFPCELRSLLDDIIHAGVCYIPTDLEGTASLASPGGDQGIPTLLVLSVRKNRAESRDLASASVKAPLAMVHLHLFSYTAADDVLDEPGTLNGKRSISYNLKERNRTELARAQITNSTEISAVLHDGFTIASPRLEGIPAEDGMLSVRFAGPNLHKEWLLQIKTIVAELGATRDGQLSDESDITPIAALQAGNGAGSPSSLLRRKSVPSRSKQGLELSTGSTDNPETVDSPKGIGHNQCRSISSIDSSTLPSIDKARRQPSILQQARAEMRAGRSATPIQPRFASPASSTSGVSLGKIRPTIVIPGQKPVPVAPLPAAPRPDPPSNTSHLGLPPVSFTRDNQGGAPGNRLSADSNVASSIGVSPAEGSISPGVLHYIDPANGRTYEIPPGMLEAFLVGTRMVGGAVNATGGGNAAVSHDPVSSQSAQPPETPMAYGMPTPPSSTKLRNPPKFEDTGFVPTQERTRKESSLMSQGVPYSPRMLPTPSPSTATSDLADDTMSMGTFGTPSSTAGSAANFSTESKRRERRGNLRDRMRQMKSQHQATGMHLDIMAEAGTVDPWDEPEEMITGQPQKRDPVVRFA